MLSQPAQCWRLHWQAVWGWSASCRKDSEEFKNDTESMAAGQGRAQLLALGQFLDVAVCMAGE
jgi:hypothetical protein